MIGSCTGRPTAARKTRIRNSPFPAEKYHILSEREADVFAELSVTELTLTLAKEGCELKSIHERDESLESFSIGLVGGEKHE